MLKSKFTGLAPVIAAVFAIGMASEAAASTLVVDRGLPNSNLNNAAGADRSNVSWGFAGPYASGDTFTLPTNGGASTWKIDKLTTWFTSGAPGSATPLSDNFSSLSLFLGMNTGPGGTIDKVATSSITGNSADAANVTISAVTYGDGSHYQGSGGSDIQIWQVDFTNLGHFSAGEYMFGITGLPSDDPFFNHASNAALGGATADGADDLYYWLSGEGDDDALTIGGTYDSNGNGWDKSSDLNIQVEASVVPLPAGGLLIVTALGGLGLLRLRRRAT